MSKPLFLIACLSLLSICVQAVDESVDCARKLRSNYAMSCPDGLKVGVTVDKDDCLIYACPSRSIFKASTTIEGQTRRCKAKGDILFIIDGGKMVDAYNFQKQINLVRNIAEQLTDAFHGNDVRIAMQQYSSKTEQEFYFDEFDAGNATSVDDMLERIATTEQNADKLGRMGRALTFARKTMLSSSHGNRADAPDLVLFFTNGVTLDETKIPARELSKTGARVIVVAVGHSVVNYKLILLAGMKPGNVFNFDGYSKIGRGKVLVDEVDKEFCKHIVGCEEIHDNQGKKPGYKYDKPKTEQAVYPTYTTATVECEARGNESAEAVLKTVRSCQDDGQWATVSVCEPMLGTFACEALTVDQSNNKFRPFATYAYSSESGLRYEFGVKAYIKCGLAYMASTDTQGALKKKIAELECTDDGSWRSNSHCVNDPWPKCNSAKDKIHWSCDCPSTPTKMVQCIEDDNIDYAFVSAKKTYRDALKHCEEKFKGTLVTIKDNAHQKKIVELVGVTDSAADIWIGLNRLDGNTLRYTWTSGAPYCNMNWAPDEPNNAGDELAVHLWGLEGSLHHQWNDISENDEKAFICETCRPTQCDPKPDSAIAAIMEKCKYSPSETKASVLDAQANCLAKGGHLPTIHNELHQEEILKAIKFKGGETYWIGLSSVNTGNHRQLEWLSGSCTSYRKAPFTGYISFLRSEEPLGVFLQAERNNGIEVKWLDGNAALARHYICEVCTQ